MHYQQPMLRNTPRLPTLPGKLSGELVWQSLADAIPKKSQTTSLITTVSFVWGNDFR